MSCHGYSLCRLSSILINFKTFIFFRSICATYLPMSSPLSRHAILRDFKINNTCVYGPQLNDLTHFPVSYLSNISSFPRNIAFLNYQITYHRIIPDDMYQIYLVNMTFKHFSVYTVNVRMFPNIFQLKTQHTINSRAV